MRNRVRRMQVTKGMATNHRPTREFDGRESDSRIDSGQRRQVRTAEKWIAAYEPPA